jgi:hypothetical protein
VRVDVLAQPVQGTGIALDHRVEPRGMRGYGPAPCLGLNQPAHLVGAALAALRWFAELPHESPHAPPAFEGRRLLPRFAQGSTILPKESIQNRGG